MSRLGKIARRTFLIGSVAVAGGVAFGYYKFRQPYNNPLLADAGEKLASHGIALRRLQRPYDNATWPHSRRGFFRLKKQIPTILDDLGLGADRGPSQQKAG